MTEQTTKYIHRLCPCDRCDIEGLQSWLEDMAAEGLFLIEDGVFCNLFSFVRATPTRTRYRLDVAQKRKPRFFDSGNGLSTEERELYYEMGWEYLLSYGGFHVYRAHKPDAPELNTESETHAITIQLFRKQQRSLLFTALFDILFFGFLYSSRPLGYPFLMASTTGICLLLGIYCLLVYIIARIFLRVRRLRQYEKRLLSGDSLNHPCAWREKALTVYTIRFLPFLFSCGIAFGLFSGLSRVGTEAPLETFVGTPPFATIADTLPGNTTRNRWGDYETTRSWNTAVGTIIEWNENCDVKTADGTPYFCILRLEYHETISPWIAKGLERDYYTYDANRYRKDRFKDIATLQLGVDSARVYSNQGSLYVLMRHGNRVAHAVVIIHRDNIQENQWMLWAQAMADKLKET